MSGHLDVLVAPYSAGNPYQRLVMDELERRGLSTAAVAGRWTLAAEVIRRRPRAVHLHWTHQYVLGRTAPRTTAKVVVFIATILLVRATGGRILWTIHNRSNHRSRSPRTERAVHRILGRCVDAVVVHDRTSVTVAREIVGRRCEVVVAPHGHYLDAYGPRIDRREARAQLGLRCDLPVILALGAVRTQKRLHLLAEAMVDLGCDAQLVIAGPVIDAEADEHLTRLCRSNPGVRYRPGFVPVAGSRALVETHVRPPGRRRGGRSVAPGPGTAIGCLGSVARG